MKLLVKELSNNYLHVLEYSKEEFVQFFSIKESKKLHQGDVVKKKMGTGDFALYADLHLIAYKVFDSDAN